MTIDNYHASGVRDSFGKNSVVIQCTSKASEQSFHEVLLSFDPLGQLDGSNFSFVNEILTRDHSNERHFLVVMFIIISVVWYDSDNN